MSNYPKYDKYNKYKDKNKKPSYPERIKEFFQSAKRVLKVATKPNRSESMTVFKICAIGTVILGLVSYVVQLIFGQMIGHILWGAP
ncbi:MAG: protein translocase SEC61 complex subunit gamma [Promethearchaeota archaeon]